MNTYQLTILFKKDLSEKERDALLTEVSKKFSKEVKKDVWGSKELAYPINKQNDAYFIHYEFEADPKDVPSLDKMLKLNEDIIRYLLIRR